LTNGGKDNETINHVRHHGRLLLCGGRLGPTRQPARLRSPQSVRRQLPARLQHRSQLLRLGRLCRPNGSGAGRHFPSLNRTYDDGYNHIDVSGNFGRQTWNWGYDNASQTPPGLDVVVMNSSSSPATGTSSHREGDPQLGFELTYNRQLGLLGKCAWGLELAFNFTDVEIRDANAVFAPVNRIADAYALDGIVPPVPGYRGTFNGPGALISDDPARTRLVLPNGAEITGWRTLNASVYGLRVGPYLDVPLCSRATLSLSAGLAVAYVDSDFRFAEDVMISGVGTETHTGAGNRHDTLFGGYVGGQISVAVCRHATVFAGAQYQNVGTFRQTVGGKTAALDLGQSIFMTVGLGVSF